MAVHNGAIITMMLWVSAMGPVGLVCVYFLLRLHFQKIKIIKKKKRNRGRTGFVRWKTEQFSTLKGSFLFFYFFAFFFKYNMYIEVQEEGHPIAHLLLLWGDPGGMIRKNAKKKRQRNHRA